MEDSCGAQNDRIPLSEFDCQRKAEIVVEERVYWNEPDGLIIKRSEFGGVLPKNWEMSKEKLCGRFFYPDGSSLTWDVCARDRLRDFNLVCLKCFDVFECAPNNMTRTGNRHVKSKHPGMKCLQAPIPFYKLRNDADPPVVSFSNEMREDCVLDTSQIPLSTSSVKQKQAKCNETDKRRLDRFISSLLARCCLPSSISEQPAFREFVEEFTQQEFTPGPALQVEKEQDKMYSALMDEIKSDFDKQAPNTFYALTAELWGFHRDSRVLMLNSLCIDSRWRLLQSTIAVRTISIGNIMEAVAETAFDCLLTNSRASADRLVSMTTNRSESEKDSPAAGVASPVQLQLQCVVHSLQLAIKAAFHSSDGLPELAELTSMLNKATKLAAYLVTNSAAHGVLAMLCTELDIPIREFPQPSDLIVDERADSELILLECLYRLRPALVRGIQQMRLHMTISEFILSDSEWAMTEQLIAVLSRIRSFNKSMARGQATSISKVYPHLISLCRYLSSPRISGSHSAIPFIAARFWDAEAHPSVRSFNAALLSSIHSQYPATCLSAPVESWPQVMRDHFEVYAVSMSLDPVVSNTFNIFHNPTLTDQDNAAIVSSLQSFAYAATARAVNKLQHLWVSSPHDIGGEGLAMSLDQLHSPSSAAVDLPSHPVREISESDLALFIGDTSSAPPTSIHSIKGFAGGDRESDVARELTELFVQFGYRSSSHDQHSADYEEVISIRSAWDDAGGWETLQKSAELHWWERNQHRFPWLSRLAAVYLAIPAAATSGTKRFAPPDGPLSSLGCAGFPPVELEKMLFIRENYHNGLLDVSAQSLVPGRRKKRLRSTGGDRTSGSFAFGDSVEHIDGNRQAPPKFLHRLITSSVSLEGDVSWHTKVMKIVGKDLDSRPQPSQDMFAVDVSAGPDPFSSRFDQFENFDWRLTLRHQIRRMLEMARDAVVTSTGQYKVDNLSKYFEPHPFAR